MRCLPALICLIALLLTACGAPRDPDTAQESIQVLAMDTAMLITTYGERSPAAAYACEDTIRDLEEKLSRTDPDSEVSRLNAAGGEAVEVGEILQPDYVSESGQYLEYREALEQAGKEPVLVTETWTLSLGNAELVVYPPQQEEYKEEDNDFSLVISMTYKERRFLFAGDSERERLEELLNQTEFDLRHDLLKVPHHGRKEKNSEEFLKAVSPEIAVITCSSERPADDKVLNILKSLDTNTYLTSEGTITCLSDGKELKIWQE